MQHMLKYCNLTRHYCIMNIVLYENNFYKGIQSVHCKFNCITVNFDGTQHGIYIIFNFIRNSLYKFNKLGFVLGQIYMLKIIHMFNLTNTFYDLFCHMSPDSHINFL